MLEGRDPGRRGDVPCAVEDGLRCEAGWEQEKGGALRKGRAKGEWLFFFFNLYPVHYWDKGSGVSVVLRSQVALNLTK